MKTYLIRDYREIGEPVTYSDLTLEDAALKFGDLVDQDMTALRNLKPKVWNGMLQKIDMALTREGGSAQIYPGIVITALTRN